MEELRGYDEWKTRSGRDEPCDCDGNGLFPCPDCYGQGWVVTCIDDMCRGAGECMHGDGERVCRTCGGDGEIRCDCAGRRP